MIVYDVLTLVKEFAENHNTFLSIEIKQYSLKIKQPLTFDYQKPV